MKIFHVDSKGLNFTFSEHSSKTSQLILQMYIWPFESYDIPQQPDLSSKRANINFFLVKSVHTRDSVIIPRFVLRGR
jgi:hypothetical protein